MWDEFTPITEYSTDWKNAGTRTGALQVVDTFFDWVNESIDGRYSTLDAQRARMLAESPNLNIKALDDGYAIEAEKLLAIQQKSSRGFKIYDINPGLLPELEYPLSLPYEFIFDGTNFIPEQNGSLGKNFRTVEIPIAGNFCKVEFIYENNGFNNLSYTTNFPLLPIVPNRLVPSAKIKYQSVFPGANGENDLVSGQQVYSYDIYARNKVFVNFGDSTDKPHIVPSGGRTFKTYFNSVSVTLNIGSPKVRITIGYNSEVYDSNSNAGSINQKMAITGAARIFQDIDTTLNPFCVSDLDADPFASIFGQQLLFAPMTLTRFNYPIIQNLGYSAPNGVDTESYGYAVFFITRIYVNFIIGNTLTSTDSVRFDFGVKNLTFPTSLGITQIKTVHNFKFDLTKSSYVFEPEEPIRVVVPATNAFCLSVSGSFTNSQSARLSYSIDGYSLGEILNPSTNNPNVFGGNPVFSKFVTDATFIPDFNRIYALKGLNQ